jgi:hypothetical protein
MTIETGAAPRWSVHVPADIAASRFCRSPLTAHREFIVAL